MRDLFLNNRFFYFFGSIAVLLTAGFWFSPIFVIAQILLFVGIAITALDIQSVFNKKIRLSAKREVPPVLSLSDINEIKIKVINNSDIPLNIILIDELPFQFQKRDFDLEVKLSPKSREIISYDLRPVERGQYEFGKIHLFINSKFKMIGRRISMDANRSVAVYPSIIQMKQMELKAFERVSTADGIKKMRRIGHSYEFEQIRNYVKGDDFRSINWKATGRHNQLMVNQYQDERSQSVYCILDKSRVMNMPFEGLSLLDYSINSTLALSNIALRKYDRVGMLSFSDKIGTALAADRKAGQLNKILNLLYKEKPHGLEANYEMLYHAVRRLIPSRSLLLMYTNFESMYALDRVLPVLRRMNRFHLLIVVFFENTEIKDFATQKVDSLEGIYTQAVAQKFVSDKEQMVQKLKQYGIQSVLTDPKELSISTINKYLEMKARGLI